RLGFSREASTAVAAADLHGVAGWGPEEGPQPAEADAPVPVQHAGERAPGDGGQCWPQDRRGRWEDRAARAAEGRTGRLGARARVVLAGPPGQAGVHPQGHGEAAAARDTGDGRPGASSLRRGRAGTRVGGTVRGEILWVPSGPWLP